MTLPADDDGPPGGRADEPDEGPRGGPDVSDRPDEFASAGQRIAAVLRTASLEAERLRDAARADAEAIRAEARVQAAEVVAEAEADQAEAEADQAEAKRQLLRARERADQLVVDAERRIAGAVRDAEQQARVRVGAALDAGRQRLDLLSREETHARERLLEAQEELQEVIQRISRPLPVIDLTVAEPTVRFGLASAPVTVAAGDGRRRRKTDQMPDPVSAADAVSTVDSLSTMVRGAVDRAMDTALEHDDPDERHPHLSTVADPEPQPEPRPKQPG